MDIQLVEAYQQGQVTRRTFLRRLLASGISLGAALAYADLLRPRPAGATHLEDDFYCAPGDFGAAGIIVDTDGFTPRSLTVEQGACVRWHFASQHSVRQPLGLIWSDFRPYGQDFGEDYARSLVAAGTFRYSCSHPTDVHPVRSGSVKVPVEVFPSKRKAGTRFDVIWAREANLDTHLGTEGSGGGTETTLVMDVDRRRPGAKKWERFRRGTTTRGARPRLKVPGTWMFRARLIRTDNGRASGWSPPTRVRVT